MRCQLLRYASLAALFAPVIAFAGFFGTSNYSECILESMKGVTSDTAAALIAQSCRTKFPESAPKGRSAEALKSRPLNQGELSNLSGHAEASQYTRDFATGKIYNGNQNITISKISLTVTTKINGQVVTNTYTEDVYVPPQASSDFGFGIIEGDRGAQYTWRISAAQGY